MASLSFIPTSKLIGLLSEIDKKGDTYVRVISTRQLAVGADPLEPDCVIDLSKEQVGPFSPPEQANGVEQTTTSLTPHLQPTAVSRARIRRSGTYWFELKGHRTECRSLKELLSQGLIQLEQNSPGTLERLSHVVPRSKKIVARDPKDLFGRDDLAQKYADRLTNVWWYGTNNSAVETRAWLERACASAGLTWGSDFRLSPDIR